MYILSLASKAVTWDNVQFNEIQYHSLSPPQKNYRHFISFCMLQLEVYIVEKMLTNFEVKYNNIV